MTEDYFVKMRREGEEREVKMVIGLVFGTFAYYIGGMALFAYLTREDSIPGVEFQQVGDYQFEFHCTEEEQRQGNFATKENLIQVTTDKGKHCHNIAIFQRGNPGLQPRCSEPPREENKLWELYSAYQSLEQRSEGKTK